MPVEIKSHISIETCDGKKQSLPLADGPIIFDVAKGAAASHGLDANTQQSKPPEEGLGASPDGLNMDATEPDPKKKKFNASEPQLTEFEQRMATQHSKQGMLIKLRKGRRKKQKRRKTKRKITKGIRTN